ncbi:MAG: beta-ketoacyl synthase [Opitutaceae bacterium]|nr:beta-ketoacyl synthase [Opitutaceae bacterium]
MERKRVFITGLGIVSGIGNDLKSVAASLRSLEHGFSVFPAYSPYEDDDSGAVKLVSSPGGFEVDSLDFEDWTYPSEYRIRREELRGLAPHGLYAYCAMKQAIGDASLDEDEVSNITTGIYTASGGSTRMIYSNIQRMRELGPMRCSPTGIVSSISGTLSFNLVAIFKILGNSSGFSSACASSGHALGFAYDDIALGRQDRMFVAAGEDVNYESVVPFTGMRALSLERDPGRASCPFDKSRNGFVSAGGAAVLVLESEDEVARRGSTPYAELAGWGQASDGHNVAISHPEGRGLVRAMELAFSSADVKPNDIDYINAHATSTIIGDASEGKAIQEVFGEARGLPKISSTKAITGHGLSLASAMEGAIVSLAMKEGFTPGSAHIEELDPVFGDLNIIRDTEMVSPECALSNSSGFGGANVALVFKKP